MLDVAQDSAGADGGELLVVADQSYCSAPGGDVARGCGELGRGGLAGLVDDDQGLGSDLADPARPFGRGRVGQGSRELGESVGVTRQGLAELVRGLS